MQHLEAAISVYTAGTTAKVETDLTDFTTYTFGFAADSEIANDHIFKGAALLKDFKKGNIKWFDDNKLTFDFGFPLIVGNTKAVIIAYYIDAGAFYYNYKIVNV